MLEEENIYIIRPLEGIVKMCGYSSLENTIDAAKEQNITKFYIYKTQNGSWVNVYKSQG
jgi:hypothetical protein